MAENQLLLKTLHPPCLLVVVKGQGETILPISYNINFHVTDSKIHIMNQPLVWRMLIKQRFYLDVRIQTALGAAPNPSRGTKTAG